MTSADMLADTNNGRLTYDPNSPAEQPVPLPSAPPVQLAMKGCVFQPPLSRRGVGPGLVVIGARKLSLRPKAYEQKGLRAPLDPDPVQKWAEEGYGVVGVQMSGETDVQEALGVALAALESSPAVNGEGRYGVLVYDPSALEAVLAAMATLPSLICLVSHGSGPSYAPVPVLAHIPERVRGDAESIHSFDDGSKPAGSALFGAEAPPQVKMYSYPANSAYFVIPSAGPGAYSPTDAALAHTRSLIFLRRYLGGPHFDLEAIWDEHTHWEFVDRSVAKTMGTMVQEPYVNHVPTMTGGVGREELTAFYRDHFIFSNPPDAELLVVSRTIGVDRVVDEFVYSCTHNQEIGWLLPQVPPSGNKLEIPMMAVVNIRGDRLYHEHIWWDQATALRQAGVLPDTVPVAGGNLRLPVGGHASTKLFLDETSGRSNEMLGPGWGVEPSRN